MTITNCPIPEGDIYKLVECPVWHIGWKIAWREDNMRRSVDSDVFDTDDRETGKRQVYQTIPELNGTHVLYRE